MNTTTNHTPGPSSSPGDAHHQTNRPAGETPATDKLLKEWNEFVEEAGPLASSFFQLVKTRGELLFFVAAERTRLFFLRQSAVLLAGVMFVTAWILLNIFLWIGSVTLTGQHWVGPLAVALVHFAVGAGLLALRERLRL